MLSCCEICSMIRIETKSQIGNQDNNFSTTAQFTKSLEHPPASMQFLQWPNPYFLCTRQLYRDVRHYQQNHLPSSETGDDIRIPHAKSDVVVDLLAAVVVEARAVDLVVLVPGEAPVPVGAGAIVHTPCQCLFPSTPRTTTRGSQRWRDSPDRRVVRLRLGIRRDIPRELDPRGERAALLAALPGVVRLGGARGRDDAGVVAGDRVAERAAVGVVGAVLAGEEGLVVMGMDLGVGEDTHSHDREPRLGRASGAVGAAVEEVDALAEDTLGGEEGGADDEVLKVEHFE